MKKEYLNPMMIMIAIDADVVTVSNGGAGEDDNLDY